MKCMIITGVNGNASWLTTCDQITENTSSNLITFCNNIISIIKGSFFSSSVYCQIKMVSFKKGFRISDSCTYHIKTGLLQFLICRFSTLQRLQLVHRLVVNMSN